MYRSAVSISSSSVVFVQRSGGSVFSSVFSSVSSMMRGLRGRRKSAHLMYISGDTKYPSYRSGCVSRNSCGDL